MKKRSIALALFASLVCSPVYAKTFVGVLWPMFGPAAAPGLVELVAELRMMPDVEVRTYLHQSWPSLVKDIDRQPPGTRTVVVGYSLGANSSVFVANKAKYVDLITFHIVPGYGINFPVADAIASLFVELVETDLFPLGSRWKQCDRARDERELEVAFPLRARGHELLLTLPGAVDYVVQCCTIHRNRELVFDGARSQLVLASGRNGYYITADRSVLPSIAAGVKVARLASDVDSELGSGWF